MLIVDPIGTSAARALTLAGRPRSLEGATIALLDNSKPNAGVLLERVGALLAARVGARGAGRPRGDRRHSARRADCLSRLRLLHVVEYPRRGGVGGERCGLRGP